MFKLIHTEDDQLAIDELQRISSRVSNIKDLINAVDTLIWQKYVYERDENKPWGKSHRKEKEQLHESLEKLEQVLRKELDELDKIRKQQ